MEEINLGEIAVGTKQKLKKQRRKCTKKQKQIGISKQEKKNAQDKPIEKVLKVNTKTKQIKKKPKIKKQKKASSDEEEKSIISEDKNETTPPIEWTFDYTVDAEKNEYKITIGQKTYVLNIADDATKKIIGNNIKFLTILNNLEPLKTLFIGKQSKQYSEISKITKHWHYTSLQSYFDHIEALLNYIKTNPDATAPPEQEADRCCICLEELFPKIIDYTIDEIIKQLEEENEECDVIQLHRCEGHSFHVGCFKEFVNEKDWIKCPVCMKIYGIMTGDQPDGKMIVRIDKHMDCDGHPGKGTIMNGGSNSQCSFPSTYRDAYLPNTEEGQKVLKLLKTCFKRKLIFTIGSSVTTGRSNQIVWNGIHHKTNTSGGASYYGWPDPTYFNRVRFELAAKGIY